MARERTTDDVWEIQQDWGYGDGWECVDAETSFKAAKKSLQEYRENQPAVPVRIKKRRVKKEPTNA